VGGKKAKGCDTSMEEQKANSHKYAHGTVRCIFNMAGEIRQRSCGVVLRIGGFWSSQEELIIEAAARYGSWMYLRIDESAQLLKTSHCSNIGEVIPSRLSRAKVPASG
jgi:hypothetical protein